MIKNVENQTHCDSIDVRLVASESLFADPIPHVPELKEIIIIIIWTVKDDFTFAEASHAPETNVL